MDKPEGDGAVPSFMRRLLRFGVEQEAVRERRSLVWVDAKCKEQADFTFGAFVRSGAAVAKALTNTWGCRPGDKILLVFIPNIEFLVAFVGCLMAGMVAVPIYPPNPRSPSKGMKILLNAVRMTEPKVALSHSSFLNLKRLQLLGPKYPGHLRFHNISKLGELSEQETRSIMLEAVDAWASPGRLGLLQFSSGSTGDPKPVALSAASLDANLYAATSSTRTTEQGVAVTWVPFYHDGGLIGSCCGALYAGALQVLTSPISFLSRPTVWLEMITNYGGTISFMPNFALEILVNKVPEAVIAKVDISTCVDTLVSAEPVRGSTLRRFVDRFAACGADMKHFSPAFGAAENCVMISVDSDPSKHPLVLSFDHDSLQVGAAVVQSDEPGAVELVGNGAAVIGTEMCVVHPDTLALMKQGMVGELWLAGTSRAVGYYNRPDLDDTVFDVALAGSSEKKFFRTGDIGFIIDGQIFVCGRLKDMLIINGKNFFPQDIEHAVELGAPKHVRPGCVAAFAVTDDLRGTEAAVVVAEVRNHKADDLYAAATAIKAQVAGSVQVQVDQVVLIRSRTIPKTTSGKIKRKQTKADLLGGKLQIVFQIGDSFGAGQASDINVSFSKEIDNSEVWLCSRAADVLGVEKVDLDDDIFDLGLTSMGMVALGNSVEQMTGSSVNAEEFFDNHTTVRQILAAVEDVGERAKPGMEQSLPPLRHVASVRIGGVLRAVLEMIGLCVVWLLMFASIIPAYELVYWLLFESTVAEPWRVITYSDSYVAFGLLVPLAIPIWMVTFSLSVIALKWVLVGKYNNQTEIDMNSLAFVRWWVVDRAVNGWETFVGFFVHGNPLLTFLWYRLMGAKVAWSATLDGPFLREFDLIMVGHDARVSGILLARSFSGEEQKLRFRRVRVCRGAVVDTRAIVGPGSVVAQNCNVEIMSVLPEGSQTREGCSYVGTPAHEAATEPIPDKDASRVSGPVMWVVDSLVKAGLATVSLYLSYFCATLCFFFWSKSPAVGVSNYLGDSRLLPLAFWVTGTFGTGLMHAFLGPLMKRMLDCVVSPHSHRPSVDFFVDFHYRVMYIMFLQYFENQVLIPGALMKGYGTRFSGRWPLSADVLALKPSRFSRFELGSNVFLSVTSLVGEPKRTTIRDNTELVIHSVIECGADVRVPRPPFAVYRGIDDLDTKQDRGSPPEKEAPRGPAMAWSYREDAAVILVRVGIMAAFFCCLIPSYLYAVRVLYGEPLYWLTTERSGVASRPLAIALLFPTIPIAIVTFGAFVVLFDRVALERRPSESGRIELRGSMYTTLQIVIFLVDQDLTSFIHGSTFFGRH